MDKQVNKLNAVNWLRDLGFISNPFFLEPVAPDPTIIKLAFIDRHRELEKVKRFAGLSAGRLLVLGRVGEGKSSLLNVAEEFAKSNDIITIRIDGSVSNNPEKIVEILLHLLQRQLEDLNPNKRNQLAKAVRALDVEEVSEDEREKLEGTVEAGIGGLIATLKMKVARGSETGRKVVYRPKIIVRIDKILEDILPSLFKQLKTFVVIDNTEKLEEKSFRDSINAMDKLPRNVLLIATADQETIGQENMNLCYKIFDDICMMKPVDRVSVKEFILGRLSSFATSGKTRIQIEPTVVGRLFERTSGNLRETFRYCYSALEANRSSITETMIIRAIADVDAPRFSLLDETDRLLLAAILKSGKSSSDRLEKKLSGTEGDFSKFTIKRRLDGLVASNLLRKNRVRRGRFYVHEYDLPNVLKEAIKLGKLLDL